MTHATASPLHTGLDRLATLGAGDAWLGRLRAGRVGLLCHPASVARDLQHITGIFDALEIELSVLFGPEHGFGGAAQDMAEVGDAVDGRGRRIVSLYGDSVEELIPQKKDLEGLDVLVVDLADVGSRYYTYIWTALLAVRAAAPLGVHTLILDRPNPIGGTRFEGATQLEGFKSFVGWEPVPVRHGLTLGEIVALHAAADGIALGPDGALSIAPVEGWDRAEHAPRWDRPFVLPSPNMPTYDTALVYPGGCLLEGTNLSEGRGHTRPFEIFGAPFLDGERWAKALHDTGLEGFFARPLVFRPTFHKHGEQHCGGVQIHVTDEARFRPVAVYTAAIALAQAQAPDDFRFRTERYEFVDDIPAFDLLTGSAVAREAMLAGEPARDIAEAVSKPDPGWADRMDDARQATSRAAWRESE